MTKKTVAQNVINTLKEIGVRHVFGVPSGAWIDYMEAMRNTEGIDFILTTHEGGAGFMAAVCGRLNGIPGVCFGTFGPGATNLATGVGCAYLDRSPMIALTDEMPDEKLHRTVQMNIDHQALFAPITKQTFRLNPSKVRENILYAAGVALSARRGPVHIGLPQGTGSLSLPQESDAELIVQSQPAPLNNLLDRMEILFKAAEKPILVIGLGAICAGVRDTLLMVAEKFQLPIVLTPMAKGMVPESHPCYAGVLFHALSDHVAHTHKQADMVISVGYDPVEYNYEDWMPNVPLVSIDTEKVDIDREKYTDICEIIGEVGPAIARLAAIRAGVKAWDLDMLAERRARMFARLSPESDAFGPCAALDILRQELPEEAIMTCDVGAHLHLIGQKWPTPAVGKLLMTNGWSAMGFAIPAAIAAKLCKPELPVCAVAGDGGFLMTVGELAVAVRENLNIVFILFTDNDLSLIRIKQEKKGFPIYGTAIREFGTIGGDSILGVPVIRADNRKKFRLGLQKALKNDGPVIVEALLDSREYYSLVLRQN